MISSSWVNVNIRYSVVLHSHCMAPTRPVVPQTSSPYASATARAKNCLAPPRRAPRGARMLRGLKTPQCLTLIHILQTLQNL